MSQKIQLGETGDSLVNKFNYNASLIDNIEKNINNIKKDIDYVKNKPQFHTFLFDLSDTISESDVDKNSNKVSFIIPKNIANGIENWAFYWQQPLNSSFYEEIQIDSVVNYDSGILEFYLDDLSLIDPSLNKGTLFLWVGHYL